MTCTCPCPPPKPPCPEHFVNPSTMPWVEIVRTESYHPQAILKQELVGKLCSRCGVMLLKGGELCPNCRFVVSKQQQAAVQIESKTEPLPGRTF